MRISDIIGMCFRNLWRRKVRTLLTVSGVVIGSCAIVVMISLGLGSNAALDQSLKQMGDLNVITVQGTGGGMVMMSDGKSATSSTTDGEPAKLDEKSVAAIKELKGVSAVFPKLDLSNWNQSAISLYTGRNNRYKSNYIDIIGVYPDTLEKFGYKIKEGQLPESTTDDFIIFGSDAAYQFMDTKKRTNNTVWPEEKPDGSITPPYFNPLDETTLLTVNNTKKDPDNNGNYPSGGRGYEHKMKTVAVLEQNYNKYESVNSVMISMEFAKQLIIDSNRLNGVKNASEPTFSELSIWVDDLADVGTVQDAVTKMGFQAFSMDTIRDQMQGQVVKQQMLLGGLAAISLFVAAIGITNTMIMSIYERTREIGVMKVLGCFIMNIRQVFLLEAGCIGLLGGILGSIISIIISIILNTVGGSAVGIEMMVGDQGGGTTQISIIPPWLILIALAFSTVIGLVSGFYPANRAVKISALEAIKNDG